MTGTVRSVQQLSYPVIHKLLTLYRFTHVDNLWTTTQRTFANEKPYTVQGQNPFG